MSSLRHASRTLPLLLVAACLVVAVEARGQTLGDALREAGWDRMIGTWVDEDTRGQGVKLTYAWRLEDVLIEATSWTAERETVALMFVDPRSGDVVQTGVDSQGGTHLGRWDIEGDDAVLTLGFVGADGQEGRMRIRHRIVDEKTVMLTIEGDQPIDVRLVREEPQAKAQPQRLQQQPAEEKRRAEPARQQQQRRPGMLMHGNTMMFVQSQVHTFNKDKNLLLSQEELEAGYLAILAQQDEARAGLLQLFDADGDGQLAGDEARKAKDFTFGMASTMLYDQSRDWMMNEKEADEAWARLTSHANRHNNGALKRFDKNDDGQLDEAEINAGRQQNRK